MNSKKIPISVDDPQINVAKWQYPATLALLAVIGTSIPAQAASFNLTYAPGTKFEQMLAFEMAGGVWSNYLADNINVNIHVGTSNTLPTSVIGGALPGVKSGVKYDKFVKAFSENITSLQDQKAFNNFQYTREDTNQFDIMANGQIIQKTKEMNVTTANAKALELIQDGNQKDLDGYILMNNLTGQNLTWDYDLLRQQSPSNNKVDFLSVAIHEVGHVLGFVSGVDKAERLKAITDDDDVEEDKTIKEPKYMTPLDLFRYSGNSAIKGIIDLSIGGNPFFSIDAGKTNLAKFSTGEDTSLGGDGNQASHWKSNPNNPYGIMDPSLLPGQQRIISGLDLLAMDVIGWDLQAQGKSLETLQNEAKQSLVDKINATKKNTDPKVDLAWLEANSSNVAPLLTENRDKDVEKMIQKSKVYEWCLRNCNGGDSGGGWQKLIERQVSGQETQASNTEAKSVPEPSSNLAFLGLSLLGIGSLFRGQNRKKS